MGRRTSNEVFMSRIKKDITYGKSMEHWCMYCGEFIINPDNATREHILPKARGGTNKSSNKGLACFRCNQDKKDMTVQEYKFYLKHGRYALSYRVYLEKKNKLSLKYKER